MSSFEMAKRFTKPIMQGNVFGIPEEIIHSKIKLQTRQKLSLNLKLKSTFGHDVNVGGMVQVYAQIGMNKRGK